MARPNRQTQRRTEILDAAIGLIERHDVASGLPGNVVWTYARDRQGALLAGTNRCLARADGEQFCAAADECFALSDCPAIFGCETVKCHYVGGPRDICVCNDDGRYTGVPFNGIGQ